MTEEYTVEKRRKLLDALGPAEYLKLHWRNKYGTQQAAAKALGCCEKWLSNIATGRVQPTNQILMEAGIMRREVVTYEVIE